MTAVNPTALERSPATGRLNSSFSLSDYLSITGSGFGVKTGFTYDNDLESATAGILSSGNHDGFVVSNAGAVSIATDKSFSGTKSLKKDYYNNDDFPKIFIPYPVDSQDAYFSCKLYFENHDLDGIATYNASTPYIIGNEVQKNQIRYINVQACTGVDPTTDFTHVFWAPRTNVWKFGRFGNRPNDPYFNNRYTHEYVGTVPASFTGNLASDEHGNEKYNANNEVSASSVLMTSGNWYYVQMRAKAGTVEGNDAFFEIRLNGIPICRYTGGSFRTTSRQNQLYGVLTPICGLDCTWNGSAHSNTQMWIDEMHTTCSDRYLVMTDSPTYSASTKWREQPELSGGWTDTQIYYTPKRGNFTQGATAYLHVVVNGASIYNQSVVVP